MERFNIKTKPAVKYFDKNTIQIKQFGEYNIKSNQNEKVQLDFNLINGKMNSLYGIRIMDANKKVQNDSFLSDFKKCSDPNSLKLARYSCDYIFGKEQKLNLVLMIKKLNGFNSYPILTTIGEIVGKENSTKCFDIEGINEKLEIKAQKLKTKINYLTIHFRIEIVSTQNEKISEMQRDEYFKNEQFKLYYKIEKNNKILYESETYTDDGKFNFVQIPLKIINSDFCIIFFNYKEQIIGKINTSVGEITNPNEKNKLYFQVKLSQTENLCIYNLSSIRDEITFLDYINNGVRVALDIGIDFTGSNGHPDNLGTLHCRLPTAPQRNPYERAILSCAKIMANYDYDQLFPVYGFGAQIKGTNYTSMCFNINFKDDPNIKFVDNIMKEYYTCLDKIDFSGPTYFSPIINKIIDDIKIENDILEYHVLMILTDGKIEDYDHTVDALVSGSFFPLSVIIVGIGDNPDFKFMEQLDGDNIPLVSSNGKKRQRDLVQFVPFNKFEGDEKKLAEEVLDEIPRQVIEYYTLNFLYPESLSKSNDNKPNNSQNANISNNNSNNNMNASYNLIYRHPNQNALSSNDFQIYRINNNSGNNNNIPNYYANNMANNNNFNNEQTIIPGNESTNSLNGK